MDDFNLTALMEREDIFSVTRTIECFTGKPLFIVRLNGGGIASADSVGDALAAAKAPKAYKVPA